MNNLQMPVARKENLVIQEMPDEVLVYDLDTNKAHCLNQTAAFVWRACDGTKSVNQINALMEKEFGENVSEEMVWLAIDLLEKDNLLEQAVKTNFNGLSRREVIKKVGLTTVVALPVVAMLSFPKSALAVNCPPSVCGDAPPGECGTLGPFCCNGVCSQTACACGGRTQRPSRIEIKK